MDTFKVIRKKKRRKKRVFFIVLRIFINNKFSTFWGEVYRNYYVRYFEGFWAKISELPLRLTSEHVLGNDKPTEDLQPQEPGQNKRMACSFILFYAHQDYKERRRIHVWHAISQYICNVHCPSVRNANNFINIDLLSFFFMILRIVLFFKIQENVDIC